MLGETRKANLAPVVLQAFDGRSLIQQIEQLPPVDLEERCRDGKMPELLVLGEAEDVLRSEVIETRTGFVLISGVRSRHCRAHHSEGLATACLAVGKYVAVISFKGAGNKVANSSFVNVDITGTVVKGVVECEWNGLNLLREIDPGFRLIDKDLAVVLMRQGMYSVEVLLIGSLPFCHRTLPHDHADAHVIIEAVIVEVADIVLRVEAHRPQM